MLDQTSIWSPFHMTWTIWKFMYIFFLRRPHCMCSLGCFVDYTFVIMAEYICKSLVYSVCGQDRSLRLLKWPTTSSVCVRVLWASKRWQGAKINQWRHLQLIKQPHTRVGAAHSLQLVRAISGPFGQQMRGVHQMSRFPRPTRSADSN